MMWGLFWVCPVDVECSAYEDVLVETYATKEEAEMHCDYRECHYDGNFFIKELDEERG